MSENAVEIGKQISFAALLDEFSDVQIPIIQRDFAQGRPGLEELRRDFLMALKEALTKREDETSLPLDLDFVYGSGFETEGDTESLAFAPLDGQQRLTTLFLLHWYLAWKEQKVEHFQGLFLRDFRSRFSYEVRPSSHDFFNRLAVSFPEEHPGEIDIVSELIEDKPWFFRSWKADPTIASALVMMQGIHEQFADCDPLYDRLVDRDCPRITFQLLELRDFGLSDDLYIKMNARGKPLTPFETFKAKLEQHLDEILPEDVREFHGAEIEVSKYFGHRMDTAWADLFWSKRDPEIDLFDNEIMNVISAIAFVSLDPDTEDIEDVVLELRAVKGRLTYSKLTDLGCLNKRMLETLIALFDYWSELPEGGWNATSSDAVNHARFFAIASSSLLGYPDLAEIAAYCAYVRTHSPKLKTESWSRWQRVIFNLVKNSDIERISDFVEVLKSLRHLESSADQILEYLVEGKEVNTFSRQQVREERIKAALILRSEDWAHRIYNAESHGYFEGQIEFLLKFSGVLDHWLKEKAITWNDEDDVQAQESFLEYDTRIKQLFSDSGLRPFQELLFERALLSLGDYTLDRGKNKSFLTSKVSSGERNPTWKLLLRGHMFDEEHEAKRLLVKALLDKIDPASDVADGLHEVINCSHIDQRWREMLVERPELMSYCERQMFRLFEDGKVYLISKIRTSSEHVELWTYYFYLTFLQPKLDAGELAPISVTYIAANSDDYVPFINLSWHQTNIEVEFLNARYRFALHSNESEEYRLMLDKLSKKHELSIDDEWQLWDVSIGDLENTICELVNTAKECDNSLANG